MTLLVAQSYKKSNLPSRPIFQPSIIFVSPDATKTNNILMGTTEEHILKLTDSLDSDVYTGPSRNIKV